MQLYVFKITEYQYKKIVNWVPYEEIKDKICIVKNAIIDTKVKLKICKYMMIMWVDVCKRYVDIDIITISNDK